MELEKKILKLLEKDAKMSPKLIATILDEDEGKIRDIIERLEREKIILGYSTVINWERLGEDGVTAMIDVKVTPEREVGFEKVAERICRFPEVRCVYLMSGTYDLSVVVTGETMKDIAWFVSHRLSTLEQVQSTVTHFVLKRYKQDDFIFEEPEEDKRLVVSP
ncbi:transcriptional regulator, AsnC family [Thermosyntropha lipolytica DSM 11003]|uniref:Transcriptional regulator, AsnC family n=1 Tax=Thermosyntropha lipolytica DSM 11003 TaxID=1123382 RepID=A0A1M5L6Q0_9FIRM|nr:Lrp/AsnC family transcriptional regulator [Thermosyntropha lipolytica]SHG60784.1 transcriptional regulator, AsnC family [Thermosyntropha lipolytica DSM 11003]